MEAIPGTQTQGLRLAAWVHFPSSYFMLSKNNVEEAYIMYLKIYHLFSFSAKRGIPY